jgi:hypothetical protein
MASWGTKRRNLIVTLFVFITAIAVSAIVFLFVYQEPTCFDGKQNGEELGIDCGGDCSLVCNSQAVDPFVHWKRYFEVSPGTYNVIAYVENQNPDVGADNVEYSFKLYDRNNIFLKERIGTIDIKPKQITPIIENTLETGKIDAARVSFEFTKPIRWIKQEPLERLITVQRQEIFEVDNLPRVSATVVNNTTNTIDNIRFVVIVYDINNNVIATSNTVIPRLLKDGAEDIIFTWPFRFEQPATRFEIIPIYDFGD